MRLAITARLRALRPPSVTFNARSLNRMKIPADAVSPVGQNS